MNGAPENYERQGWYQIAFKKTEPAVNGQQLDGLHLLFRLHCFLHLFPFFVFSFVCLNFAYPNSHPNVTGSKFHCRDIPDDITRFQRIYLLIIISHLHWCVIFSQLSVCSITITLFWKKLERKISIIYDIYFEWFRIKLLCHTLDIYSQGGQ